MLTAIAALSVMAAQPGQPPSFGLVGCTVSGGDRFVVDDRPTEMVLILPNLQTVRLPRDLELTEPDIHVSAGPNGPGTLSIVIERSGAASLIRIDDMKITVEAAICEAI